MRFIFLILSFFNIGAFANVKIEDFNNNIHHGYEIYEEIVNESNQYYSLKVVWGINNNKVNYSIYFYNETPKALRMLIMVDNQIYTLPSDTRNDIAVQAFNASKSDNLKVIIMDKENHIYSEKTLVTARDKNDFLLKVINPVNGLQEGMKVTKLKRYNAIKNYSMIIFALFSVIILTSAIIIVLIITRKGVFGQDYDQVEPYIYQPINPLDDNVWDANVIEDVQYEEIDDTPKTVYNKMMHYEDDIELEFDVSNYLKGKGFDVNYPTLTESQKELIMLELMMMRDTKIISLEQYNYEVIRLWS